MPLSASPLFDQLWLPVGQVAVELTLSFQVLLDGIILDFHILHDRPETLDGIVQSGNDTRRSKLTEPEKQHQAEGFDIVVILQRLEDALDECREVDFGEACAELKDQ